MGALAALLLTGCSAGPAVVSSAPGGITAPTAISADLVNSQLWPGEDDVLLAIVDQSYAPLVEPDAVVELTVEDPDGRRTTSRPTLVSLPVTGRQVYRARLDLHRAGTWPLEVSVELPGGTLRTRSELMVQPDDATPAIGDVAPAVDTPTLAPGSDVSAISSIRLLTDTPPLDLYRTSERDALAEHRPFVFIVDSAAFTPTQSCGGGLAHIVHLVPEFPDLLMIHAEPWLTQVADGRLALDPADGPPRLAPWSVAWGVTEAPWVFVVDAAGHVVAKFNGVMGTDELRDAFAAVQAS